MCNYENKNPGFSTETESKHQIMQFIVSINDKKKLRGDELSEENVE